MKSFLVCLVCLASTFFAVAQSVIAPQDNYLVDYQSGSVVKKFGVDANNDGIVDWFFNTVEANLDPAIQVSDTQNAGSTSWEAYVSVQNTSTFKIVAGLDVNGTLLQGTGLELNVNFLYVGNIAEISRYGIVTLAVKRSKSENSTIIYAYTWETDHFKQWVLAEYPQSQSNSIFDSYLKDDKRNHVVIQQIKP